jgi:hypothetical protein
MCHDFTQGRCERGSRCRFSHGADSPPAPAGDLSLEGLQARLRLLKGPGADEPAAPAPAEDALAQRLAALRGQRPGNAPSDAELAARFTALAGHAPLAVAAAAPAPGLATAAAAPPR